MKTSTVTKTTYRPRTIAATHIASFCFAVWSAWLLVGVVVGAAAVVPASTVLPAMSHPRALAAAPPAAVSHCVPAAAGCRRGSAPGSGWLGLAGVPGGGPEALGEHRGVEPGREAAGEPARPEQPD